MVDSIYRLYKKLHEHLELKTSPATLKTFCQKYSLEEFNLFKFIGDCTLWNIAHLSVQTSILKNPQLPFPIVVKLKNRHHYALILNWAYGAFHLYDSSQNREIQLSFDQIIHDYEPWAILIEPTVAAREKSNKWLLTPEQKTWMIPVFFLSLIFMIYLFQLPALSSILLLILSILGILVCREIKEKESGYKKAGIEEICENKNLNLSCDKVINSSYARIFSIWSLSDIGMAYFIFLMLFLFLGELLLEQFVLSNWFALINAMALLFTGTLFFIQRFLIRSLCPLCLMIFGVVGAINFITFVSSSTFGWGMLNLFTVSALLAVIITTYAGRADYFFKHHLWQSYSLQKIIDDNKVFRSLLNANRPVSGYPGAAFMVNYREGAQRIDLIISDSCGFCKKMLFEMLRLLLMTDQYAITLRINSKEKTAVEKLNWLSNTLSEFNPDFNQYFDFALLDNNSHFRCTLDQTITQQVPEPILTASMANDSSVTAYPTVFLKGRVIPTIYSGTKIKLHLMLMQYN